MLNSRTIKVSGLLSVACLLMISVQTFGQDVINPKGTRVALDTSKWKVISNDIHFKNTGNVGIGINPPLYKLDVSSPLNPLRLTGLQSGSATDSVITEAAGVLRRVSLARLITDTSIYKYDGGLTGNRIVTMATNNLTLNATTGNFIYNPSGAGSVNIGTATAVPSAVVNMSSTSRGVLVPSMTTGQRLLINTPANGLLVYDITTNCFWVYKSSLWVQLVSGTPTINTQSGTTYTLSAADNGSVLEFTNTSPVTLTVPSGLPAGFQCSITQLGTGIVTVVGSGGVTIRNPYNYTKTAAQYSKIGIEIPSTANTAILSGDAM